MFGIDETQILAFLWDFIIITMKSGWYFYKIVNKY